MKSGEVSIEECMVVGEKEGCSGMVSWSSKKQKTIVYSMCVAEYMAASEAGQELV